MERLEIFTYLRENWYKFMKRIWLNIFKEILKKVMILEIKFI